MKRVMVDLETLDNLPTAMIVSIGAVAFDPDQPAETDQTFYRRIDARQSHGTIGADTVLWWLRQSDEARAELSVEGGDSINVALLAFSEFCQGLNEIWAGPSYFDVTILENAYRRSSLLFPWKYFQVRDWSTLRKLTRTEKAPNACAHNALADAQAQVAGFRQAWQKLKQLTAISDGKCPCPDCPAGGAL